MKRVQVYKWINKAESGQACKFERTFVSEAVFHEFGCNYEEFESGPGNFSTAIVEYNDGSMGNIPVENIEFIKE